MNKIIKTILSVTNKNKFNY